MLTTPSTMVLLVLLLLLLLLQPTPPPPDEGFLSLEFSLLLELQLLFRLVFGGPVEDAGAEEAALG